MSGQNTQELSPEVVAQAKKLLEKKTKALEKSRAKAESFPGVVAGSLRFDPVANKNQVDVECVRCGKVHQRYTSDLHQTNGICPDCKKDADKDARVEKKALLAKAMLAIKEGKIK